VLKLFKWLKDPETRMKELAEKKKKKAAKKKKGAKKKAGKKAPRSPSSSPEERFKMNRAAMRFGKMTQCRRPRSDSRELI